MEIIEKLKDQGWYLTEEGIKKLPEDVDKSDPKKIIQTVMDMDLRGIAEGALPSDISKKDDSILGRRVLQIAKIRNISAPKVNEESKVAPRFLQIELTDGANQIFALEFDNISSISLNTPPGTKLYLRSDRIPLIQGQLVLRSNDVQILGGKVQHLIEKWEMTRTLQKYTKSGNRMAMSGSSGPPPWIPFGQEIKQNIAGVNDKNFKSLGGNAGDKENKEKNEFDTMRSEAIAEAAKAGAKKIFGGGNQQLLDHNLKKIMEKGFTEEEARNALKANRNIVEQALYNLKRRDEFKNKDMGGGKRGGFKDTKKSKNEEPIIATKPAANVSLFDFLTDKLPANPETSDKNVSNKSDRPKSFNHDSSKPPSYHSQQQQQQQQHQQSYNHQHQASNTHYQSAASSHQQQSHHQQKRDQHSQQQQHQQQSQSQYHQMQQQSHSNYNHASRPKFENNLSSSFATRNTSSSEQQQQQSHDNYKNRDKNSQENVQNVNAYSSNRQKDQSEKFKNNQRNSNYGQSQRPNERYGGSGYQKSGVNQQQNQQQSQHQHQSQSQHQHQLQPQHQHQHQPQSQQQYSQDHQSQQQQNQYQVKTTSSGSYDSRNRNDYQKRNGFDSAGKTSSNSSRYHSKDSNSHQPTVRNYNENRQQSNVNESGKMNKLVEETSKMKIESTSTTSRIQQQQQQQNSRVQSNVVATSHHQIKPYQQQHHQQQPPPQQAAHLQQRPPPHSQHQQMQPQSQSQQPQHNIPPHTTYAQLPNGFTYDPSKIMGFQSKEANDFAMTLLKSQAAAAAIPPIPVAPHAPYPPPIQIPPTFPAPQFVMPAAAAAPPQITGPYGMTQCGGENWNWKIGDRCLAKYWDDGRYYEAEVTGVSDKTCVVLYLGYGNHEEVLKSDCLPITDVQHRPINISKLHETHPPPPPPTAAALANAIAPAPPPAVTPQAVIPAPTIPTPLPASISQHALSRVMHSSRYRGERQMYVPPPKRDG